MLCSTQTPLLVIFLWDYSLIYVGCFFIGELFSKGWLAESTEKWAGSTTSLDFSLPCGFVSHFSRKVDLASCDVQRGGIQHLPPFSGKVTAHYFTLTFSKNGTSFPFFFRFCILSQGSGMPPSLSVYPDFAIHWSQWFLSSVCSAHFGQALCYLSHNSHAFAFSLLS